MKKTLFIIMVATCLASCSNYYAEEERAQNAYYVVDSVQCEVRGVWELVDYFAGNRRGMPNKRYDPPAPIYHVLITPEAKYWYNWQEVWLEEDDIMMEVSFGDTVRVHGTVRTLTNEDGRSFQDIIVDSILEITSPIY